MKTSGRHHAASHPRLAMGPQTLPLIAEFHQSLPEHRTAEFSRWIDEQLVELEWTFRHFVTPQTLRQTVRR